MICCHVFVGSCSNLAQQDSSNNADFNLSELKQISNLLTEVEARRVKDSLNAIEINQYDDVISNFMDERKMWIQKEENYKALVESVKPNWYEKPFFISSITAAALSTIYLLIK